MPTAAAAAPAPAEKYLKFRSILFCPAGTDISSPDPLPPYKYIVPFPLSFSIAGAAEDTIDVDFFLACRYDPSKLTGSNIHRATGFDRPADPHRSGKLTRAAGKGMGGMHAKRHTV
jgi:hypothetical protein